MAKKKVKVKKAAKKAKADKLKIKVKAKAPPPAKKSANRLSWLDAKSETPLIDDYARQLDSFIQTMADGVVDDNEIKAQEKRLVKLMKEVEPGLDDATHEKVTKLLCELTAYDIMQLLHTMQQSRPKSQTKLNL